MSSQKKWFSLRNLRSNNNLSDHSCDCGNNSEGCNSHSNENISEEEFLKGAIAASVGEESNGIEQVLNKPTDRRSALKKLSSALLIGAGVVNTSCNPLSSKESKNKGEEDWEELFKGNYKLMTDEEKKATVGRLEKKYSERTGKTINVSSKGPIEGVLYGYAFNISKCQGFMDCVAACHEENNHDRDSDMRYIRIHEIKKGEGINFEKANDSYGHEVPAEDHFYIGTQCFHCDNPPCVKVCPVEATWREDDGLVVVDYDWCIGCRYCMAACPYDGRRFNWSEPNVPNEEINSEQHYLGNRLRKKGVMEKCTFCIQRSRKGKNPACVEACPTGARVFGNLLDPNSAIRNILENKKVFRLKEDLGTEPKFWYFMD